MLIPSWVRHYRRGLLAGDLTAGLVSAMLLVPQGMAYAALAGLPPHLGLYASLLPLVAYAWLGSSAVLSVGPVAVIALMTASALGAVAAPGSPEYIAAAALLALLSGLSLLLFGLLRLGAMAHLLSHPVISGFTTGAAILILIGQLRPLLGLTMPSASGVAMLSDVVRNLDDIHLLTAAVGLSTLALLLLSRHWLAAGLHRLGIPEAASAVIARLTPMVLVLGSIGLVHVAGWADQGLAVTGELPAGLPPLMLPWPEPGLVAVLLLPALVIGLIGFVESVAVASSMARARGERMSADAELRGLGAANIAAAVSGAFPVAGGFSRTAVHAEAGANTALAGLICALVIALVLAFATGLFTLLPSTVLAATIIAAVLPLVDFRRFASTWRYDRADATAMACTAAGVVAFGVEVGVALGVALSLASLVWRSSRPHIAVVGQVPGTEHFRNVLRHQVVTRPGLLMLRVDENLFFGNAEAVLHRVEKICTGQTGLRDLVLVMSSVSHVDTTALEALEALHDKLGRRGVALHFAEVKGPVLDRLAGTALIARLSGRVFLSNWEAFSALPEPRQ
ncbi:MAG: sulfate permease [Chromatiales bacterium]|nr:sulfate permease [Chromatiales bacterium]